MTVKLTWLGHGTFFIDTGEHKLLVDPFLTDNPAASTTVDAIEADFILVSHGHGDHVGDLSAAAEKTGATVIANFEIANWAGAQGMTVHPQHIGGGYNHPFGYLKFTQAHHGSGLPDGSYGGNPAGFLITFNNGKKLYLACDTGLFGDMALIGEEGVDVAVLPIGDNFTMGPDDAVRAVKLIKPGHALPAHYNTWGLIAQDADAWAKRVETETEAKATAWKPGDTIDL
jgi:L-ascorbate metabolism protein UlaG (beta-lactamase superfamily)